MVVVKCWQILERPIVRAFCSAFVQQTFGEDSGGCSLDPKSPLCLDDPRGFGGNGRQWAKCSARENWLRAAKTGCLHFRISIWKLFFFNHHQHSTIFICTFHSLAVSWWYERTGEIGARFCETKHAIGKAQLLPNHIPTCLYLAPPILLYQLAQSWIVRETMDDSVVQTAWL